jgi:RND superfamily putative drug exporter
MVISDVDEKTRAASHRFWLAMSGFVAALLLVPFSYRVEHRLETAVHIRGGEAEAVDHELTERFQSPYAHRLVVVIQGLPDADSPGGEEILTSLTNTLRSVPGVSGAVSSLDWPDPLFTGKNGGALIVIGLSAQGQELEGLIPQLRARTGAIESQLRPKFPAVKLQITGETPLNLDLRRVSANDVNDAEGRVLPVTLILLFVAFGSLVAAMLPLGVGVLSISMTMGAAALLAHSLHLSILVQNLATMLGLGLGIDYALLMVSRFREALADGNSSGKAADIAARQAGRTLMVSAATVAIGFSALLTVPISELRSIGVAGLLVTAMSVMLCTLILPWVLGLLGHRINAGRLRLPERWRKRTSKIGTPSRERWRWWGKIVTGRPWTALFVAGIPLLILSYQAHRIVIGLPASDWLPAQAESVKALYSLRDMGRTGIVQSLRVVLELPANSPPLSQKGWVAATRLTRHLQSDARTDEVISLPTLSGMAETPDAAAETPDAIRKSFLRSDRLATLMEVLPAPAVSPTQQIEWVRELRASDVAAITGVPGAVLRVGGIPGLNADYDSAVKERIPKVIGGVVIGGFFALLVGLRSLFAAVKAVILNLLSVGASFGTLVLVFQEGHGSRLFGVGPLGVVFPIVPILSFAVVFGLSMDYEVFLVVRVLEERRRGLGERAAVVEGLASTGGLITSAAAIMITVFGAFTMGSFLVVKMLGFALAVAVFIDGTAVRMVVGPALLKLAGDWNWWPLGLYGATPRANREQ